MENIHGKPANTGVFVRKDVNTDVSILKTRILRNSRMRKEVPDSYLLGNEHRVFALEFAKFPNIRFVFVFVNLSIFVSFYSYAQLCPGVRPSSILSEGVGSSVTVHNISAKSFNEVVYTSKLQLYRIPSACPERSMFDSNGLLPRLVTCVSDTSYQTAGGSDRSPYRRSLLLFNCILIINDAYFVLRNDSSCVFLRILLLGTIRSRKGPLFPRMS